MIKIIDLVGLEHLKGEQRELAELIGIDAYRKILSIYGGEKLFISRLDSIISQNRASLVKSALKTASEAEIIDAFNITKREFERIKIGCK